MPDAAYYAANKVKGKEDLRAWRDKNWVRATLNRCTNNARSRAAQRGIPFELTSSGVMALYVAQDFRCALTGLKFQRGTGDSFDMSPSIDRVNNLYGYVPGNVRIILNCVNAFKGRMTDEQMLTIAKCLVTPWQ